MKINSYSIFVMSQLAVSCGVIDKHMAYDDMWSESMNLCEDFFKSPECDDERMSEYNAMCDYLIRYKELQAGVDIELPKDQISILRDAIKLYQSSLNVIAKNKSSVEPDVQHLSFDLMTLHCLLNYDVTINMSKANADTFTADNGIDLPEYK